MTEILVLVAALVVIQVAMWVLRKSGTFSPPERLTLERGGTAFQAEAAVNAQLKPLIAEGFRDAGSFLVKEMKLSIKVLFHPTENVWAVGYDRMKGVEPFVDLVMRYEDGTSITYNNSTYVAGNALDKHPGHDKVSDPGLDAASLYRRLLEERPQKPAVPTRPAEFKAAFEKAYADEMAWRKARGGATPDEIRRVAAASGRTVSDGDVRKVQDALKR